MTNFKLLNRRITALKPYRAALAGAAIPKGSPEQACKVNQETQTSSAGKAPFSLRTCSKIAQTCPGDKAAGRAVADPRGLPDLSAGEARSSDSRRRWLQIGISSLLAGALMAPLAGCEFGLNSQPRCTNNCTQGDISESETISPKIGE